MSPLPENPFGCLDADPCPRNGLQLVPSAAWTLRTGHADGVETGVGLHTAGVHGDVKLALLRRDAIALAVAPSASVGWPMVSGALPVLLDLDVGPAVTLTLAASPTVLVVGRPWTLLGLGAGVTWRVRDGFAI